MAKTVLIVEDEESRRKAVEHVLRTHGYETLWTDASSLAWEYLDRNVYAVFVQDRFVRWEPLPGDGYGLLVLDVDTIRAAPGELARRREGMRLLRKLRSDTRFGKESMPVIGMTHHMPAESDSWREEFMDAQGNEFFEWTFDWTEFVNVVGKHLRLDIT